ncbi:uncharacterized protein DUF998 [Arthrobacter sp. SLBN-100]|uniref:DUF998 domain-containing protein n=1 Tax=Arthrobacter sp. SLBN-100 TaxID=2768450 RepID=UPI001154BDD2|nr:DUF998 domain-containing protein [Arthrobacter sp. SLBN-100]TQJ66370.1 uncharacterized protein DUF998 [Arthrobacter sp. SLBN-100]
MSTFGIVEPGGDVISRWWRSRAVTKGLILAAIPAVAVYVITDVVSALLYKGYSFLDQAISELSAFGSPVRPLMVTAILTHAALLLAFAIGVLRVARRGSALWWIGAIGVAGFLVVGIPNHTFWAMSSRGTVTGFNDTMHITLSIVFTVTVIATMILSAIAYRGWFRLYAMATLAVVVAFGAAAGFAIRGIEQNETAWAGGFERINAYAYLAWLIMLTVMVTHHELGSPRVGGEVDVSRPEAPA